MANNKIEIEKSYIDNYSIKDFTVNQLIPKYFPDIDASLRTIGMIGMTSEFISNIAEDSFNTTSVLFRESIPNRAELPESIYSHASIFQLSNIFSKASSCSFLIVLEEESIINNMTQDSNSASSMYYFYLDKNTTVYVEDVPYVLDYDIRIRCVKKKTTNDIQYIFTASYILDEYTNSISDIVDPYIKIRRSNAGYIALEVKMHQMTRDVQYEQIVTNSKINMPYVDINFDGQLVGFDILYKTAEESTYTTQMQKLLVYSQPLTQPFCYYQLYNDDTLRLTFNSKDSYFTPKFNSELKVILYLSKGKEANFDAYTGSNITIEPDMSVYNYDTTITMAAKPLSGSTGGDDKLNLEALQALTIEGYRTAMALTTESDLSTFFSNYKYNYGDFAIKFIKRRNDVYERIFGGYCLMQYESEIFKTNTLDIHMNLSDMTSSETNIYMIEPGTVFEYLDDTSYATFSKDSTKTTEYYNEYMNAITNDDAIIYYVAYQNPDTDEWIRNEDEATPVYLRGRKISFAEFKSRKGYDDKVHVFNLTENEKTHLLSSSTSEFKFINPFLIRIKKSPNLVSLYQTYINDKSMLDFTNQNDDMFVQFVSHQVQIERSFDMDKEYTITTAVMPSITLDKTNSVIAEIGTDPETKEPVYNLNDRSTLDQNDLRVIFVIYDNGNPVCYSEMYPITYSEDGVIMYETKFRTNDHISSDNRLQLVDDPSLINMTKSDVSILIPTENVECKIFTLYRKKYVNTDTETGLVPTTSDDTNNIFVGYDPTYDTYVWTNEYTTGLEPLTFIKPLTHVRSALYFEDFTATDKTGDYIYDIMDARIESVPFIKWSYAYDPSSMAAFMTTFITQYENISSIINNKLRNETSIDVKFYNTYGRSKNYYIGDDIADLLDTLNLRIEFDMWFIAGTDIASAIPEIKQFIKDKIETISDNGTNQIHVSNLMREIEHTYSYVDHIRFKGFNDYPTDYQSIKLAYTNIDDLDKEARRKYVPELLIIDLDDIIINEFDAF